MRKYFSIPLRWVLVHGRVHPIEQTDQAFMMILRKMTASLIFIDAIHLVVMQTRAICDLCSHLFFAANHKFSA